MAERDAQPTAKDIDNAQRRAAIATRQIGEYDEALALAEAALGKGFRPWMKLSLLDSDYHHTDDATPVAVAFKVYRGQERLTENCLFIRRFPDGSVRSAADYEELFPELREPHPTRRLEVKGKEVPAPRWSLCWSSLERYEPKSAEALAASRANRGRKRDEREEQRFQQENPLLAQADILRRDLEEGRDR